MYVFAFVPVVSSVDSADDISFNQTGILLTIPTPFSATRAIRSKEMRALMELWKSFRFLFFFLVTVRIGETILAPTTRFANSSEGGKQDVSSYQKRGDEKPGLKETFSLLRLQNSKPFLEGSREWKKSQADDGSDKCKKDKKKISYIHHVYFGDAQK